MPVFGKSCRFDKSSDTCNFPTFQRQAGGVGTYNVHPSYIRLIALLSCLNLPAHIYLKHVYIYDSTYMIEDPFLLEKKEQKQFKCTEKKDI